MPEEENSGAVYSVDMDITFISITQKDKSTVVKCILHPEQKQLQCAAKSTLALCKHKHKEHANVKLAKDPQ